MIEDSLTGIRAGRAVWRFTGASHLGGNPEAEPDDARPDPRFASFADMASRGGIDILVNNAALFDMAPIVEITRESHDRLFSINVAGTLFVLQAAARLMIAQGWGEALVGASCATKAAVISLTQSAGLDLIRHRINVNAIAPALVAQCHSVDGGNRMA